MPLSEYAPEMLAEARRRYYADLGHVPKLGQRLMDEAVDAGKRYIGFFTPPQDGKSYHIAKHIGVYLLVPNTYMWLVGPTYQDASKEFGYLYQDMATLGHLRSAKKHFDVRGGNMDIELRNGSWVRVISAENPENLRREQLDVVVLCEATKLTSNLYDRYLYGRVERRHGKVYAPTTHKGYGWCWEAFRVRSLSLKERTWTWGPWANGQRAKIGGDPNPDYDPEYWSCQVSYVPEFGEVLHEGEYTAEAIEKARKRLLPQFFAEQFGGEACSYAGLVYPFDPTVHECEPFDIPDAWTHVVGYDHGAGGGSDPTAILFGSYDPDGVLYWWGEIYSHAQRSIASYATQIRLMLQQKVPQFLMRGRDAKQVGYELQQAHLNTMYAADPSVEARIVRMGQLLQTRKWKMLRGACPNLKREILNYEWDEKRPGEPRDHQSDHALEAAGYATLAPVSLPTGPRLHEAAKGSAPSLAERIRIDRVWGGHRRDHAESAEREQTERLERILEPDPLSVVEEAVY